MEAVKTVNFGRRATVKQYLFQRSVRRCYENKSFIFISHHAGEGSITQSRSCIYKRSATKNAFLRLVTLKPIKSEQSAAEEHHSEPTGE